MILAALAYGPLPSAIDTFDRFHLTHPSWSDHARLHLLWLIFACSYLGLTAAYLAWRATPRSLEPLHQSARLGGLLLGAFFSAGIVKDAVGASFGPPEHFVRGFPIPVLHFGAAAATLGVGYALCLRAARSLPPETTP